MALIGFLIGLAAGAFGLALGLVGGFIGIAVGLLGGLIGLLHLAVPIAMIVLGVVWLVRSSSGHDQHAAVAARPTAAPPPTAGTVR